MLDREKGASPRFELLDANAAADNGAWLEDIRNRARQAVIDCENILGDPAVLTAAMNEVEVGYG